MCRRTSLADLFSTIVHGRTVFEVFSSGLDKCLNIRNHQGIGHTEDHSVAGPAILLVFLQNVHHMKGIIRGSKIPAICSGIKGEVQSASVC